MQPLRRDGSASELSICVAFFAFPCASAPLRFRARSAKALSARRSCGGIDVLQDPRIVDLHAHHFGSVALQQRCAHRHRRATPATPRGSSPRSRRDGRACRGTSAPRCGRRRPAQRSPPRCCGPRPAACPPAQPPSRRRRLRRALRQPGCDPCPRWPRRTRSPAPLRERSRLRARHRLDAPRPLRETALAGDCAAPPPRSACRRATGAGACRRRSGNRRRLPAECPRASAPGCGSPPVGACPEQAGPAVVAAGHEGEDGARDQHEGNHHHQPGQREDHAAHCGRDDDAGQRQDDEEHHRGSRDPDQQGHQAEHEAGDGIGGLRGREADSELFHVCS